MVFIFGFLFFVFLYLVIRQTVVTLVTRYHEQFTKDINKEVNRVFYQIIEQSKIIDKQFLSDSLMLFYGMHLEKDHGKELGLIAQVEKWDEELEAIGGQDDH